MRAVVQRVSRARVSIAGETVGAIDRGLVVLLGIAPDDTLEQARWLADKIVNLRIFNDEAGVMNISVKETGGDILLVSQFSRAGFRRSLGRFCITPGRPRNSMWTSPDKKRWLKKQRRSA